ncbi:MAG: hypothetical protein MR923_08650 [Prevotella sp.]|nr:hypothetical protein [Prevotella sp.]
MKHIILLTSCVNPNGMPFTALSDINVRKQQYLDALRFYVNNTPLPIVYVDNSNVDIKEYNVISNIVDDRLEILSFDGNHDKEHGKGYGELEIIDYAIKHSNIINSNTNVSIIKITGRLVIVNIMTILNQLKYNILPSSNSVICSMNSDFSMADSRLLIAPLNFYKRLIENRMAINDSEGVYLEHVLCSLIKKQNLYAFHTFFSEPQYQGVSGSTNITYEAKKHTFREKIRYAEYVISQIFMFPYAKKKHFHVHFIRKSFLLLLLNSLKLTNKLAGSK